jgi:ribosome assembly protein 4
MSKKAKTNSSKAAPPLPASVVVQFQSTQGESTGPQVDLPTDSTPAQLELLINELRKAQGQDGEDSAAATGKVPYSCYVNDVEVTESLRETLVEVGASSEGVITVTYQPLAVFRVRPVVRCTDTMPGHTEVGWVG